MNPQYIPLYNLGREYEENTKDFLPPEDQMSDLEKDRKGAEDDTFDTESASYMDKQGVIVAEHRTDYTEDQTGCGSKFSSKAQKPTDGRC